MDSRYLLNNLFFEVDGMEFVGRRELRHHPSTNARYTTMLDNLEELEQTRCAKTSKCIENGRHPKTR